MAEAENCSVMGMKKVLVQRNHKGIGSFECRQSKGIKCGDPFEEFVVTNFVTKIE